MKQWKSLLGAVLLAVSPMMGSAADPVSDASVLLQVDIPSTTGAEDNVTLFKIEDLMALPAVSFETATIWTEGVQSFTGVSLTELASHLGVSDGTLVLQAVNDYVVEFPLLAAVDGAPIIAYERNGAPMSRRNKGPLWVVFPYDSDPDFQTEEIFAMSVWQLVRITVRPDE